MNATVLFTLLPFRNERTEPDVILMFTSSP